MNGSVSTQGGPLTPEAIQRVLQQPLPGLRAQARMAPIPRPSRPPTPDHRPREGGVLVLLYPGEGAGDLYLVLTRRTDTLGNHRGQISFPGGSVDPADPSTTQTALREACEEIGVCRDDLCLLGDLTPLYIPPSDFCIHPHVGFVPQRPAFVPQPAEVAELLEVPVRHFLDDRHVVRAEWIIRGEPRQVPYFDVYGHQVWGATAMVLAEFAAVLKQIGTHGNT